jgi:hypothetical protein
MLNHSGISKQAFAMTGEFINKKPKEISLGEHMVRTQMFMQALSDKMPEIANTIQTLMKIKKLRKERLMAAGKWNPQSEGIEDEASMNEDSSITEGGFGLSSLPVR